MLTPCAKAILKIAALAIASLWLHACEFPARVNKPKEESKPPEVYEVGKEANGLALNCLWARVEQPAKVTILFSAKNAAGAPIKGLTCEHFAVYEDSAAVSVRESAYRVQSRPPVFKMHTLLLLDMSGSVVGDKLDSLKAAAAAFVRALLQGAAAANIDLGIYWFDGSEHIHMLAEFTTDTSKILAALQNLNEGLATDRSTNLHGAIIEGMARVQTQAQRQGGEEVAHGALVVFTDGADRADRFSFAQARAAVEAGGAQTSVYMIGLGEEIDTGKLKVLAKDGFAHASHLMELVPKFDETAVHIQNNIESRYLLEYCSPKRKGRHTLRIEAALTEVAGLRGAVTISFPADGFTGGCEVQEPCAR